MGYITKKSNDEFKTMYEQGGKYSVTWLGDIFGKIKHECFYRTMEVWCTFIDSLFPDWFPLTTVLIEIVKYVYNNIAWRYYFDGVDEGNQLISKFNETLTNVATQIQTAINEAKTTINNELITPIQNTINNELSPKITALQTQLSDIETEAGNALTTANSALSNANSALEKAATALQQAQTVTQQVKDASAYFTSQIAQINTEINSAKSRLSGIDTQITSLISRVKALEQKVSAQVTTQKTIWEKLFGAT